MKFSKVIGSCFIVTFFSACQQAELENSNDNDLRMSIVASIKNQSQAPKSRLQGDDPKNVSFGESDQIGVFIDGGIPLNWTLTSSGWQSDGDVFWPDKDETHSFYAFYPYVAATSLEEVPVPSLLEQTGDFADVCGRDFLVASTEQTYGNDGVVNFGENNPFVHKLSLLELKIKGDGDLKESELNKISIEGTDIVAPGTYSFIDKKVTLDESEQADLLELAMEHEMNGTDKTFYFIVNPKSDESTVKLTIEYTYNETTFVAEMSNFASNVFTEGEMKSFVISIKDRSLIITGSTIQEWGGNGESTEIEINGKQE